MARPLRIEPGFRNSDEKFRIAKKIERRLSPCGPSHFDAFTGFYCGAVRISGDNPLNHKHYFSSHISQYFDCGIRAHIAYCTEAVRRVYSYGVDIIEKLGSDSLKRRLIVTLVYFVTPALVPQRRGINTESCGGVLEGRRFSQDLDDMLSRSLPDWRLLKHWETAKQ